MSAILSIIFLFWLYSLFGLIHTNEIITRSFKCRTRNVFNSQLFHFTTMAFLTLFWLSGCFAFCPLFKLVGFLFQLDAMHGVVQSNGNFIPMNWKWKTRNYSRLHSSYGIYTSYQRKLIHLTNYHFFSICRGRERHCVCLCERGREWEKKNAFSMSLYSSTCNH